jgi:hypothetical protein
MFTRTAILCALALTGCGSSTTTNDPPGQLYGEVHVHGFLGGSHPGALFVATPVPAADAHGDDIVDEVAAPIGSAGDCVLRPGVCSDCPPPPDPIEGGTVRIRGGLAQGDVELVFVTSQQTYLPTTSWTQGPIFTGGETLSFDGAGAAAPGFSGSLVAPVPLVLTTPSSQPRLGGGDFAVAWIPDQSTRIDVVLLASTRDGRAAMIECVVPDADGQVTIASSLLAGLPAPPRDVELQVSRDVIVAGPSSHAGWGVLLHAGFETELSWHEDL